LEILWFETEQSLAEVIADVTTLAVFWQAGIALWLRKTQTDGYIAVLFPRQPKCDF